MSIESDQLQFLAELIEESKFFAGADDLSIECKHKEIGDTFFDDIVIDGRNYSYTNKHSYNGELERKRYAKRFTKLALYLSLSDYLHIDLPWGALTGIRPVKFAYGEGKNWRQVMKNQMRVSDKKLEMVGQIIENQTGCRQTAADNYDLFIGIPFCPTRCSYCSFVSNIISKEKRLEEYVDALCREITAAKLMIKNLRSVYIGGGTPVSLSAELLEKILAAVGNVNCEYTVEAGRPDCIDENVLSLLQKYGVTRICVNPQTFNDKTLEIIGRKHTAADIREKYAMAKKFGFDINMDLIAGLPQESFSEFKYSVDEAVALSPDDITVHTLSLKKGSKLKESIERLDAGEIEKMIDYAYDSLTAEGYKPYYTYRQKYMAGNLENTGYAKSGKVCIYNVDVMEETADNIACGANAVSKKLFDGGERIERFGAPKDIATYIAKIDEIISEKNKLFSNKR